MHNLEYYYISCPIQTHLSAWCLLLNHLITRCPLLRITWFFFFFLERPTCSLLSAPGKPHFMLSAYTNVHLPVACSCTFTLYTVHCTDRYVRVYSLFSRKTLGPCTTEQRGTRTGDKSACEKGIDMLYILINSARHCLSDVLSSLQDNC